MSTLRVLRIATVGLALLVGITGCSATIALEPADGADDPQCAEVMVRLPDTLGGEDRQWTNAQATAAWGSSAPIIMRCGVEPPGPTTLQCVSFGGVDWIVDTEDSPYFRLTTYGREPAVQMYVDTSVATADSVIGANQIISATALLPQTAECVDPDEAEVVPEDESNAVPDE